MRYIGGKSKIAKGIVGALIEHSHGAVYYYEPFVGGGSVLHEVAKSGQFLHCYASDISPDLIVMWNALYQGWAPPKELSEWDYNSLRHAAPSALRGLAGFGGSFGGKWFGGYARGGLQPNGKPRNHFGESARNARAIADSLPFGGVTFSHRSYDAINPIAGSVIYADPPYADSEGYSAAGQFDTKTFWVEAERWHRNGCAVFVSEYTAPDHWRCIWESAHRRSLAKPNQGRPMRTEKLFTL